ncbi:MAG: sigma 54-interacting transcriptional regulator [Deltaproteobacteria bacterium]
MPIPGLPQEIMDRLSDPIAVLDRAGTIVYANEPFTRLCNPSGDPRITKPCDELLKLHAHLLETGRPMAWERLILGPLNRKFDVLIHSLDSPVTSDQSERLSAVLVKVEEDGEREHERFNISEDLMNAFTSAWKIFSEELSPEFASIKGEDVSLRMALLNAQKAAKTDFPIMIIGESGTGKELLAQAIHRQSPRREGSFVDVNCAAIPESLIESELFGYEKGAFTGALREGKKGLFDQADGGTIFLDEIGDASLAGQSKLLRVLQGGEFMRVGGTRNVRVDVRIISATNKELDSLVRQKRFRDDLYYRLNTVTINLPPLRKRGSDIRLLAQFFLEEHARWKAEALAFSDEALRLLEAFPWPGNIRELKSVVDYAATMSEWGEVGPESLPFSMFLEKSALPVEESLSKGFHLNFQGGRFLRSVIRDVEKNLIAKAIEKSRTRSQAIRMLGISRRTFYKKIKEYDLDDSGLE